MAASASYNAHVLSNIREWWRSLETAPEPMLPGEKLAAWIVGILVAVTRWLALAKTPWDWDEALFMSALRHFDVRDHHPHPPGFPLFIGTARLFTFVHFDAFHALQHVSFIAAVAIVPAMLFLGRELRLPTRTALIAAVFLAMFPNVWLFGGTAFSDVPSMTLVIVAIALFLRGCRSDEAFLGGAIVLGIAAGYRPQNLTIGFAPAVIASLRGLPRHWLRPIIGALVVAGIVGASYGVAVHLSGGWAAYSETVHAHQEYITNVDSFHNPARPPLWHLAIDFFVRPYHSFWINITFAVLACVSVLFTAVRLRASILMMLAAFGPFCLAAWLYLDHFSASRFSIGYSPLFAILAADGLQLLLMRSAIAEVVVAAVIVLRVAVWAWPSVHEVRRNDSPPFAAARWIRKHFDPRTSTLYVHHSMGPLVEAFLPGMAFVDTGDGMPPANGVFRPGDVFVIEGESAYAGARVFRRSRTHLPNLVRDRYFAVSILPPASIITFADGWYDREGPDGAGGWRWMGHRARAYMPAFRGRARLALHMYVPLDALKTPPTITITLNGSVVDRIRATTAYLDREYSVDARPQGANELVIETDEVVNPAKQHLNDDARDLGIRVTEIEWGTAPPAGAQ
jgi:hypothetical protein